ncbi:invasion associated locus B family protein [Sediminicoccus sp. KRV36]|uniref:invasion associated locus B family protein n=1 Tax=Sediminicoccus sp. KRV36 TaxID=3133721 RepID=UPI002010C434|nr:invasion associated locus B family protein [Sediminicoccus rosea]UPY35900.1 invasion associated locus B family protein [Sediminicoccus rosea]
MPKPLWLALILPLMAAGFAPSAEAQPARAQPAAPAPAAPAPAAPSPPAPAAAPAPTPSAELPDRTQANFGDWLVRCETQRPAGQPVARVCELAIAMNDQRGQPIAQLVIGRPGRADPHRMLVQLPLELRVDQPARLLIDPGAPPAEALILPFRLCSASRGGCFGELEAIPAPVLARMRARAEAQGRLDFRDSAGREIQILFSFRGFGQALDGLAREIGG